MLGIEKSMSGKVQNGILAEVHAEQLIAVCSISGCGKRSRRRSDLTQVINLTCCIEEIADSRGIEVVPVEFNISQGVLQMLVCLLSASNNRVAKSGYQLRACTAAHSLFTQLT